MIEIWIRLDDLPAEGREFNFPEQEFWTERFSTFDLEAKPGKEMTASAQIMRQDDNAFIRGQISGSVFLSCDRCAENFELTIDTSFDEFESREAEIDGEVTRIQNDQGVLTLNMGEVLWEQFMLALPMKPICTKSCKGVCCDCGANLNEAKCDCTQEGGDTRLAVFRDLKVE